MVDVDFAGAGAEEAKSMLVADVREARVVHSPHWLTSRILRAASAAALVPAAAAAIWAEVDGREVTAAAKDVADEKA